jgi:hypothetical protein
MFLIQIIYNFTVIDFIEDDIELPSWFEGTSVHEYMMMSF